MSRLRPAADRVWVGGALVFRRTVAGCAAWARAGSSMGDTVARLIALAVAAYVAWLVVRGAPVLLWPATAVLLVCSYRAGPAAPTKPRFDQPVQPAAGASDGSVPEVSPEAFLALLDEAIGEHRGVHLKTLVGVLAERFPGPWDIPAVKALCQATGVVVTPTVRAPGRGPTVGVYREGNPLLSPTPPQDPPVAVVAAGQEPTTSPTTPSTTGPTTPRESVFRGYRVRAVDDPDDPARTHTTVTKERTTR